MTSLKNWVAAPDLVAVAGTGHAALVNRGGGMIYDTTRSITWLADMNYAFTSGYTANGVAPVLDPNAIWTNGRMGWNAAVAWADQLVYGGFSDWRLPTVNPADTSCSLVLNSFFYFNCTGGELSGLFVTDLGNKANESVLNQVGDTPEQIANLALFSNVQRTAYWSGTESAPNSGDAWAFDTGFGTQVLGGKFNALYALAVRPGDVTASVPEPATLALTLLALGATVVARRRRAR